jgi:hypothetical protein
MLSIFEPSFSAATISPSDSGSKLYSSRQRDKLWHKLLQFRQNRKPFSLGIRPQNRRRRYEIPGIKRCGIEQRLYDGFQNGNRSLSRRRG